LEYNGNVRQQSREVLADDAKHPAAQNPAAAAATRSAVAGE
jgi:hypothetical protein